MSKTTIINDTRYTVTPMLNSWDMNYHFIDENGTDYLVDMMDVMEFTGKDHATLDDAIELAQDLSENNDGKFWWTLR